MCYGLAERMFVAVLIITYLSYHTLASLQHILPKVK